MCWTRAQWKNLVRCIPTSGTASEEGRSRLLSDEGGCSCQNIYQLIVCTDGNIINRWQQRNVD